MKHYKVLIAAVLVSLLFAVEAFSETVNKEDPNLSNQAPANDARTQATAVTPQAVNASAGSNAPVGSDSIGCCGGATSPATLNANTNQPVDAQAGKSSGADKAE